MYSREQIKNILKSTNMNHNLDFYFNTALNALKRVGVLYEEREGADIMIREKFSQMPTNEICNWITGKGGIGIVRAHWGKKIIQCLRNETDVNPENIKNADTHIEKLDAFIDDRIQKLIYEANYGHTENMYILVGSIAALRIYKGEIEGSK